MELGNVHKYNYLGVIVDDKLLFDEFVEHKYNNINVRILQLRIDKGSRHMIRCALRLLMNLN